MKLEFDPQDSTWHFIHEILEQARAIDREEPVAKHLVGTELSIRAVERGFPADSCLQAEPDEPGDYFVNNASVHVAANPHPVLYDECLTALIQGYRVYLLVPAELLTECRQNVESVAPGRITVWSIEDFASHSIDDWLALSDVEPQVGFRRLLEVYNERVNSVETDKSMLIEIPKNLLD